MIQGYTKVLHSILWEPPLCFTSRRNSQEKIHLWIFSTHKHIQLSEIWWRLIHQTKWPIATIEECSFCVFYTSGFTEKHDLMPQMAYELQRFHKCLKREVFFGHFFLKWYSRTWLFISDVIWDKPCLHFQTPVWVNSLLFFSVNFLFCPLLTSQTTFYHNSYMLS